VRTNETFSGLQREYTDANALMTALEYDLSVVFVGVRPIGYTKVHAQLTLMYG
jgi:hypothetical protein